MNWKAYKSNGEYYFLAVDASQLLESLMKDDDSASEAKQGLPEGKNTLQNEI